MTFIWCFSALILFEICKQILKHWLSSSSDYNEVTPKYRGQTFGEKILEKEREEKNKKIAKEVIEAWPGKDPPEKT